MRATLCALPAQVDVARLCTRLGLPVRAPGVGENRAAMHASVLGLSVQQLSVLGDELSEESSAEHEVFAAAEMA